MSITIRLGKEEYGKIDECFDILLHKESTRKDKKAAIAQIREILTTSNTHRKYKTIADIKEQIEILRKQKDNLKLARLQQDLHSTQTLEEKKLQRRIDSLRASIIYRKNLGEL